MLNLQEGEAVSADDDSGIARPYIVNFEDSETGDVVTIAFAHRVAAWRLSLHVAHMRSAAFQTRRAFALEHELLTDFGDVAINEVELVDEDERLIEHTACVVGAIFAVAAAIESAVAAVFVDAYEVRLAERTPLQTQLAAAWGNMRNQRMRERAKEALRLVGTELGKLQSWNDVNDLLKLRNLWTHYTEGSIVTESTLDETPVSSPTSVEKALRSRQITPNPLQDAAPFPFTYISSSCAAWAVMSGRTFIEEFYTSLGRPSPFLLIEKDASRRRRPSPFTVPLTNSATE